MSIFDDLCEQTDEDVAVSELINRKRRQLVIHSIIYYELNGNIWSDAKFDATGRELVALQAEHGHKHGYRDELFKDWEGGTGFHLAKAADRKEWGAAIWLIREHQSRGNVCE